MFPFILRIRHSGGMNQLCFLKVMLVYTIRNVALSLFNIDLKNNIIMFSGAENKIKDKFQRMMATMITECPYGSASDSA